MAKLRELWALIEPHTFEGAKQHLKEALHHADDEIEALKAKVALFESHLEICLQAAHIHVEQSAAVVVPPPAEKAGADTAEPENAASAKVEPAAAPIDAQNEGEAK